MKSISSLALAVATLLIIASNATDDNLPSQGCFDSTLGLTVENTTDIFTSKGSCSQTCMDLNKPVFGMTNKTWCYCGSDLPPANAQVDNSSCSTSCPGYPANICGGGSTYISVYLTADSLEGTVTNVNSDGSTPSSTSKTSPSTTASATQSVVTVNGQTVVVTASPTAAAGSGSGGASKAGIAAGVVVGLIALAAIGGGIFLFIRNKQRREVEEEYRRNAAISAFTQGGDKHPSSSGGASTFSDMRLDPAVMAQRRMSDGSIADNQDYSRRILKVTNA